MMMDRPSIEENQIEIHNENALSKERAFDFSYLQQTFIPNWIGKNKTSQKAFLAWNCNMGDGLMTFALSSLIANNLLPYKILATEKSYSNVESARNGVYKKTQVDIAGVDVKNHILLGHGDVQGWVKFKDEVLNKINFQQHDMTDLSYLSGDLFDVILAEDFEQYTDNNIATEIALDKIHRSLKKDGILMIQSAARIPQFAEYFTVAAPGIYKKI